MSHEYIEIRGARENNLTNASLRIPKRQITVFSGVSGSGKSTIVFDTIASEARRQAPNPVPIWVIRLGDDLYDRSVNGRGVLGARRE